jgi:hypothetical protein
MLLLPVNILRNSYTVSSDSPIITEKKFHGLVAVHGPQLEEYFVCSRRGVTLSLHMNVSRIVKITVASLHTHFNRKLRIVYIRAPRLYNQFNRISLLSGAKLHSYSDSFMSDFQTGPSYPD